MTTAPAHEILRRLFDVIVSEAEENPALAQKLGRAIWRLAAGARIAKPAPRKPFDAPQFHAINVLRSHGEAALRGKLEQVKAVEDLRATASGLVLSGSAGKAPRAPTDRRHRRAAKHYDAQRSAATA